MADDRVLPRRIDPRPIGSSSRTLKEGIPSALGESDAASIVALEFQYACGSPTKTSDAKSHHRRALFKKPVSSRKRSRMSCRASPSYSCGNSKDIGEAGECISFQT